MTTKEYTWADLEAAVGQDFSGGEEVVAAEVVERSGIRRFCEILELGCPLHWDEEVAKSYGYRDLVLPVSAVNSTYTNSGIWKPGDPTRWGIKDVHAIAQRGPSRNTPQMPAPPTIGSFATDIEIEYLQPVCVGDRLTRKGQKLVSVTLRETSVGYGAFTVTEGYIYNQRGELVAITRNGGYRYNPHPPEKLAQMRQGARQVAASQAESSGAASGQAEVSQPRSDWSQQIYWEDVNEDDPVPGVSLNITVQRLVMEAGANRDFAPIHHDTVLTQRQGVEEMYANNIFVQAMWERSVREYIGVGGRIKKVGPFRMRVFNQAGYTVTTKGKVIRKWQDNGENFVELQIWSENDRGVSVGPGPVTVTLPSRPR